MYCHLADVLRIFIVALLHLVAILIIPCTHTWNFLPVANGFGEFHFFWIVIGERFSNVDEDGSDGPRTRLLSYGVYLGK